MKMLDKICINAMLRANVAKDKLESFFRRAGWRFKRSCNTSYFSNCCYVSYHILGQTSGVD